MKILVADDDQAVREALRRSLSFNGYDVVLAKDGEDAVQAIHAEGPDLSILDVMMPRKDGLEVCRELRSAGYDRPILILTARDGVSDRVAGLDAGADDYLPKPFALEELLARTRSLLRRALVSSGRGGAHEETEFIFGDLHLNLDSREASRGSRQLTLTRTEFSLLGYFMENPGRVLTREDILAKVWQSGLPSSGNALEVYVGYLRKKTEAEGEPRLIHTVRGVGYVLRENNQ